MRIVVNGEPRELSTSPTLERFVLDLGHDPRAVAVERNGAIVRRAEFAEIRLAEGDRLEIVRFVQGG